MALRRSDDKDIFEAVISVNVELQTEWVKVFRSNEKNRDDAINASLENKNR
jgi:hypothetical protein